VTEAHLITEINFKRKRKVFGSRQIKTWLCRTNFMHFIIAGKVNSDKYRDKK
jgi:hypothetical protein